MNYILLFIIFLALFKLFSRKENFSKSQNCSVCKSNSRKKKADPVEIFKECIKTGSCEVPKTCLDCRMTLSKDKRSMNIKVNPVEIFKECIKLKSCVKNNLCNYCVTKDKSSDPNLVKTVKNDDYGDYTVDLNNCKKFRNCRDNYLNGYCDTKEWNIEGGQRYCCNPCVSEIRKNIDEADENALDIARTCASELKMDENRLWKNIYDTKQGVCSQKTLEELKRRKMNNKKKQNANRLRQIKLSNK